MALWLCCDPHIPRDILFAIRKAFIKLCLEDEELDLAFKANPYNRAIICKILRAVEITEELREKYKSRKFKQSEFTKARFYEKYGKSAV